MGDDQLDLFGAPKPARANFPTEATPTAQIPLAEKVEHVRAAKQERDHRCHWPGCPRQVPPARWGCRDHWYRLPRSIRDKIWSTYRPGQEETLSPSREYVEAARIAQRWIAENVSLEREALADAAPPTEDEERAEAARTILEQDSAFEHDRLEARLAKPAARPVDPRVCPVCEAQPAPGQPMVCSVMSERLPDGSLDMFHLVTTFECSCGYRWTHKRPRTDVCPHGLLLKVPCGPCGRSWAEIEGPQPPPAPAQPAPSQPAPRARRRSVRSDG